MTTEQVVIHNVSPADFAAMINSAVNQKMALKKLPQLITIEEMAEVAKVSVSTVNRWLKEFANELQPITINQVVRLDAVDVEAFLIKRKRKK